MVTLRQIRAFISVYEEGAFSRATSREHATQSGLSMLVRNLELELHAQLFERTSTGVVPTPAGRAYYSRCLSIFRALDAAKAEAGELVGMISGRVAVGLMPIHARSVLAPALARFSKHHPKVDIYVVEGYSGQLADQVAAGELDFAIVPEHQIRNGLREWPLGVDRELLISSPSSQLSHMAPVRLAELGPIGLVLPARPNARRQKVEEYCRQNGVDVRQVLTLDAMMGTLELVAQSDWMTILPTTIVARELREGGLTLSPLERPAMTTRYIVVELASRSISRPAGLFLDALVLEADRLGAEWATALDLACGEVLPR